MNKKISIIVPIYNEQKYIKDCLESILKSDYNQEDMEILLVDGGSLDDTLRIIKEYQKKYTNIILLHNPKKIVPIAMNIGIKNATGDYIIRLDAHASYPKNYFSKLIYWHEQLDAANVGTTIETKVKNLNKTSVAIKKVLSNRFGVGSAFRSSGDIKEAVLSDTVPFGCYKREIFDVYGLYDERLARNQDIELNKRISKGGGKIYLIPSTPCTYFARETFKELAKNNFENGKWNILTAYYTKSLTSLSIRHFIPLLFVLAIIIPLFLSIFDGAFLLGSLFILLLYFSLVVYQSVKMSEKQTSVFHLIVVFYLLHISYGIGSLVGIFEVLKVKFRRKNRL